MSTWSVPTNKQQTAIVAGPSSSQTLTMGTPIAHSLLVCVVAWTGAVTVTIADSVNSWLSIPTITNGSNHVQMWYCLDSLASASTLTATFSANATNIQIFNAEYPVGATKLAITAASQSGSITTYTCSITEGSPVLAGMPVVITGMADAGNNTGGSNPAFFIIQSVAGGPPITSFTVDNPNGVTRASQSGTGIVGQQQGLITVSVDADLHTATGTSTAPSSGAPIITFGDELWIGYADAGTSLTWAAAGGSPYTLRSTAATSRGAYEDVLNASGSVAGTATFAITSNPWEAGVITFSVSSVGTSLTLPAVESNISMQGPLIATPNARYSINTDPMGSSNSGSGNGVGQIYPTGRN